MNSPGNRSIAASSRSPEATAVPAQHLKYVIITPARNEESNIEETIRSVASQTILPTEWIVVDDGSTDKTPETLDRFASIHPWIHVMHLPDRGFREPGSGVIRTFAYGLQSMRTSDWDFLVKLDGDLSFAPDYFEKCFAEFEKDPKLAVGGGTIHHERGTALQADKAPRFHVRGATKIYRRAFWEEAGGVPLVTGWDTLDEVKANMLGWSSRTFAHVPLVHRRLTGSADGAWKDMHKNGRANYITGYHPLFMALKCLKRIPDAPFFIGALALFCGFMSGYLKRIPQVDDKPLIRYVREQQIRRLLLRASIWQ